MCDVHGTERPYQMAHSNSWDLRLWLCVANETAGVVKQSLQVESMRSQAFHERGCRTQSGKICQMLDAPRLVSLRIQEEALRQEVQVASKGGSGKHTDSSVQLPKGHLV